jgi:hypothetical protein
MISAMMCTDDLGAFRQAFRFDSTVLMLLRKYLTYCNYLLLFLES